MSSRLPACLGLLAALLLTGCATRPYYHLPGNQARLPHLARFAVGPEPAREPFIWDQRPLPSEGLKSLVVAQFQAKGYGLGPRDGADFWLSVHAFAPSGAEHPRAITLVVEVLERTSGQRLWFGQAELATPTAPLPEAADLGPQVQAFLAALPARL